MDAPSELRATSTTNRRTALAAGAAAAWAGPAVLARVGASAQASAPPTTSCAPTVMPLASPGAESGVVPPWQVIVGSTEASSHAVGVPAVGPVTPPPGGGASFFGETDSSVVDPFSDSRVSGVFQIVEIPAPALDAIDAGGAVAALRAWFAVGSESGAGFVSARAFPTEAAASAPPSDLSAAIGLSPNEFGSDFDGAVGEWVPKSRTVDLPPGSRYVRVDVGLADRASTTPDRRIRAGVDVIEVVACP